MENYNQHLSRVSDKTLNLHSYINGKPKFSNLNNIDYYDETEIDVSDEFIDIIIKHLHILHSDP